MDIREHFFQDTLKRTTFERNAVRIFAGPLPGRLRNAPVRRFVFDGDTLWRVQRIEAETIHCREATNQELADIMEAEREQKSP